MYCLLCFSAINKLQEFIGHKDNDTFKNISVVLPELILPESEERLYICVSCLEEVKSFYEIKIGSLENFCLLNQFKSVLQGTNNFIIHELSIKVCNEEVFKYLQDDASSSSSNDSTQNHTDSDMDIFTENDLNSPRNDSGYNEENKNQDASKHRRYECNTCGKALTCSSQLERHKRIHTGEKPYKCQVCHKKFTRAHHVNRHKLIHTGEKPHECDVCHKKFNRKSSLITHKRIHTNDRAYKCSECGYTCTVPGRLSEHKRIHTGERPHHCHICQYKSAWASNLKTHIRTHHNNQKQN